MLREITEADLPTLFEHQADPQACAMAAFVSRPFPAFMDHWRTKILASPAVKVRAIVHEGKLAGYVSTWNQDVRAEGERPQEESLRLCAYWIGREFWGLGLASQALTEFIRDVEPTRPLDAFVATSNVGSIRVLQKAGFELVPDSRLTGDDGIEEVRYRLLHLH
jgi:RimJ/RimL family protein N-acetyltransferase